MSCRYGVSRVAGILVDLDDTLYPQSEYLTGAWRRVAAYAAAEFQVPRVPFEAALQSICAEGSDRGRIIDRALARVGRIDVPVSPLVEAFTSHRPQRLHLYPGAAAALHSLQAHGLPVCIVTDGSPLTQSAKLTALGVTRLVGGVVLSDELGRQYRKPHPRPVLAALELLRCPPSAAVMIGDRPDKDMAAAAAAGVRSVRVRTGEHRAAPDHPFTWRTADSFALAVAALPSSRVATA